MAESAYDLTALNPLEVRDALRAQDYANEADAIGLITSISTPNELDLGYSDLLRSARLVAFSARLPQDTHEQAEAVYGKIQALHEERLHDVERLSTDFLTRKPGVLHMASLLSPSDREPLVRVEFVPQSQKPYKEASLVLHGLHGVISGNVWDRELRCDATLLPKRVRKFILKQRIAEEA